MPKLIESMTYAQVVLACKIHPDWAATNLLKLSDRVTKLEEGLNDIATLVEEGQQVKDFMEDHD